MDPLNDAEAGMSDNENLSPEDRAWWRNSFLTHRPRRSRARAQAVRRRSGPIIRS